MSSSLAQHRDSNNSQNKSYIGKSYDEFRYQSYTTTRPTSHYKDYIKNIYKNRIQTMSDTEALTSKYKYTNDSKKQEHISNDDGFKEICRGKEDTFQPVSILRNKKKDNEISENSLKSDKIENETMLYKDQRYLNPKQSIVRSKSYEGNINRLSVYDSKSNNNKQEIEQSKIVYKNVDDEDSSCLEDKRHDDFLRISPKRDNVRRSEKSQSYNKKSKPVTQTYSYSNIPDKFSEDSDEKKPNDYSVRQKSNYKSRSNSNSNHHSDKFDYNEECDDSNDQSKISYDSVEQDDYDYKHSRNPTNKNRVRSKSCSRAQSNPPSPKHTSNKEKYYSFMPDQDDDIYNDRRSEKHSTKSSRSRSKSSTERKKYNEDESCMNVSSKPSILRKPRAGESDDQSENEDRQVNKYNKTQPKHSISKKYAEQDRHFNNPKSDCSTNDDELLSPKRTDDDDTIEISKKQKKGVNLRKIHNDIKDKSSKSASSESHKIQDLEDSILSLKQLLHAREKEIDELKNLNQMQEGELHQFRTMKESLVSNPQKNEYIKDLESENNRLQNEIENSQKRFSEFSDKETSKQRNTVLTHDQERSKPMHTIKNNYSIRDDFYESEIEGSDYVNNDIAYLHKEVQNLRDELHNLRNVPNVQDSSLNNHNRKMIDCNSSVSRESMNMSNHSLKQMNPINDSGRSTYSNNDSRYHSKYIPDKISSVAENSHIQQGLSSGYKYADSIEEYRGAPEPCKIIISSAGEMNHEEKVENYLNGMTKSESRTEQSCDSECTENLLHNLTFESLPSVKRMHTIPIFVQRTESTNRFEQEKDNSINKGLNNHYYEGASMPETMEYVQHHQGGYDIPIHHNKYESNQSQIKSNQNEEERPQVSKSSIGKLPLPFSPKTPDDIQVGDTVKFMRQSGKITRGSVKYVGTLPGKEDAFIGVELENEVGAHDGIYNGERFFQSKPNQGVFVAFCRIIMVWRKS